MKSLGKVGLPHRTATPGGVDTAYFLEQLLVYRARASPSASATRGRAGSTRALRTSFALHLRDDMSLMNAVRNSTRAAIEQHVCCEIASVSTWCVTWHRFAA